MALSALNSSFKKTGIALLTALFFIAGPSPALNGASCQEKSLDELINLNLNELADVVVTTPSKTSQKLNDIPGTVRIITAGQIADRGYSTLDEALSDLPGMQFRNINGFNSYVFMRGLPSQNNLILVLIDGVQINELNSGGFYGGAQYNLANVERIEVVYGPTSAMYGTNAVSGVINIITKKPADSRGIRISSMAGGFGARQYDLIYGHYEEKNDLGLNISAMFKSSKKADLKGGQGDGNWSDAMDNFEDDSAIDAKVQHKRFTFGLNYQNKKTSYATKEKTAGTLFKDFDTSWHISFLNAYLKYDYRKNNRWSWNSTLYYRDSTVEDDTLPLISMASAAGPGYQERWYRPNHMIGLENRLNRDLSRRLSLVMGTVSERESLSSGFSKSRSGAELAAAPAPQEPAMLTKGLSSVYAQLQLRLSDPVSLTAGARFDDSDTYGKVATPRIGLVFNKDRFNAKLSYAEAYRAPKPWDYNDGLGNPGLTPEEMKAVEFAAGYSFTENLHGGFSIYRNTLANSLVRENIGANWHWSNIGRIKVTGIEGNLEYKKNKLKSYLNYTYTNSADQDGSEVAEISPNTANAGFQYAFTERLNLDLRGQYLGKRKNTHPIGVSNDMHVGGAFVLNGTLNFSVPGGYEFQLSARNIFNKEYYHTSNSSVSAYRQPQSYITIKAAKQF